MNCLSALPPQETRTDTARVQPQLAPPDPPRACSLAPVRTDLRGSARAEGARAAGECRRGKACSVASPRHSASGRRICPPQNYRQSPLEPKPKILS
ncbi:hypothetical protein GN956_G5841 [Arapaima gigas]